MKRKNILITGTSSGIGKMLGVYLTEKEHRVLGTSRNASNQHPQFEMIQLDITQPGSVEQAVQLAIKKLGRVDVLINNAGIGICGPIENTSIAEAKNQFDTNYFGVVRMTQGILPHMKANQAGMILNIGSLAGLIGLPFQGHYTASKFALEGFCEALRIELMPFNIKVSNINPGDFKTSFTQNRRFSQEIGEEYEASFEHFLKIYEHDEKNGAAPILIAKKVERLLYKSSLKPRYMVGKTDQTIGVPIKRLLGNRLFEKVMLKIWKVD